MADVKISQLTALASASSDVAADVLAIVDTSVPQTKKITIENLVSPITLDKSNSRVGIGTASPSEALNVRGSAPKVKVQEDGSNHYVELEGGGSTAFINFYDSLRFREGTTERMRIDGSGNVGINETNPAAKMDIDGDIQIRNANALLLNHTGGGASDTYINSPADNVMAFRTGGTERMRIHSDGRISIKSATLPQDFGGERGQVCISSIDNAGANNYAVLQLQGHSITNDAAIGGIYFYDHSNNNAVIQASRDSSTSSADLIFYTNGGSGVAEGMRLDSAGNLGIGAASFGARLHAIVADAEYAAYFTSDDPTSTNAAALGVRADYGSGTRVMQVFFNGGSNIGEITYNGSALTYGGTSDERLKKDISSYTGGLSIINQMGVKNFTWKEHDKKDVGLIAQELYDILPSRVVEGTGEEEVDRPWQVDYPRLVPYLISAVQELSSEITDLKKK